MRSFNYETKLWGVSRVTLSAFDLNSLKLKFTLEDLEKVSGQVLDVGCGGGGMAKGIKAYRHDINVFGIDISKYAIKKAKRYSLGVDFQTGDVTKLDENYINRFSAVVMYDVLEHLNNPGKVLANIFRILKKGGIFSLFVPLDGSLATIHGWARKFGFIPKLKYAGHAQQFKEKEVIDLLKRVGFKIEKKRNTQYLFSQIVDFAYFTFLYLRGKNIPYSIETYLTYGKGFKRGFTLAVKSIISLVSFVESLIFSPLPGLGLHLKAIKS